MVCELGNSIVLTGDTLIKPAVHEAEIARPQWYCKGWSERDRRINFRARRTLRHPGWPPMPSREQARGRAPPRASRRCPRGLDFYLRKHARLGPEEGAAAEQAQFRFPLVLPPCPEGTSMQRSMDLRTPSSRSV
jgi:hypothetical protein